MTLAVHHDTFLPVSPDDKGAAGTVEITLRGKRITVNAYRFDKGGDIYLRGFVGRYRTSRNAWRAVVSSSPSGRLYAHFGRDDRSGRFQKINAISYEPETYAAL